MTVHRYISDLTQAEKDKILRLAKNPMLSHKVIAVRMSLSSKEVGEFIARHQPKKEVQ